MPTLVFQPAVDLFLQRLYDQKGAFLVAFGVLWDGHWEGIYFIQRAFVATMIYTVCFIGVLWSWFFSILHHLFTHPTWEGMLLAFLFSLLIECTLCYFSEEERHSISYTWSRLKQGDFKCLFSYQLAAKEYKLKKRFENGLDLMQHL